MHINNLEQKQQLYKNLDERQRRQFAAILAGDLGHGGQLAVSKALNIEADTIRKGKKELENNEEISRGRVRKEGGGRKKKLK